jgi:transposase-like protein
VAKKRVETFARAFRQMAVDRLAQCDNIVALAKELGISRRLLYTWREKLEPVASGTGPPSDLVGINPAARGESSEAGVGRDGLGGGFF